MIFVPNSLMVLSAAAEHLILSLLTISPIFFIRFFPKIIIEAPMSGQFELSTVYRMFLAVNGSLTIMMLFPLISMSILWRVSASNLREVLGNIFCVNLALLEHHTLAFTRCGNAVVTLWRRMMLSSTLLLSFPTSSATVWFSQMELMCNAFSPSILLPHLNFRSFLALDLVKSL